MTDESSSFLDLLNTEFELPQEDDRLFRDDGHWRQAALVGGQRGADHVVIEQGYKRAGDILVESALSEESLSGIETINSIKLVRP